VRKTHISPKIQEITGKKKIQENTGTQKKIQEFTGNTGMVRALTPGFKPAIYRSRRLYVIHSTQPPRLNNAISFMSLLVTNEFSIGMIIK